ncbi:MAG: diaminopimelate epimerase [Thermoanaerobaculia bacterium]
MVAYYRLSGGGNDFLAFTGAEAAGEEATVRAWCTRGLSLGADGIFVLSREGEAIRMEYRNADGRPADLCLNGTRCAVRLAAELGWMEEETTVLTGAGPVRGRLAGEDRVALELPPPEAPPARRTLTLPEGTFEGWSVHVGVPHWVLEWPATLADAPVAALGPALRHHPDHGLSGANVDFVRVPGPHRLEIRSFERGVEAETLACGTGVLAAVAAAVAAARLELPVTALTAGGFELTVEGKAAGGRVGRWSLAGDARIVARGEILPGAGAVPPPPAWSG